MYCKGGSSALVDLCLSVLLASRRKDGVVSTVSVFFVVNWVLVKRGDAFVAGDERQRTFGQHRA